MAGRKNCQKSLQNIGKPDTRQMLGKKMTFGSGPKA